MASESGTSQYLKAVGPNPNLPASAQITGIQVDVKKQATSGQLVLDQNARLYINNVISGNNYAKTGDWIDTGLTYYSYGSSTDTWGLSGLLGSDMNNANFGFGLSISKDAGGVNTGNVDAIRFTFFYTLPSAQTQIFQGKLNATTIH